MAAIAERTRLEVENITKQVTVPSNNKAKLMYYLDSIASILDLDGSDAANLRRLRDYQNHYRLTADETRQLILLCALLSPDILLGKCIIAEDEMCGDLGNAYQIKAIQSKVNVSRCNMIAGKNRSVDQVMFFKMPWLQQYYLEPIKYFADQIETGKRPQESENEICVIS